MALEDVGGIFKLSVNGVQMNLKGDPTIDIGGKQRTLIMGADGRPHGYQVRNTKATVSGTFTDTSELDLVLLRDMKNATIKIEKPNGKTVIISNAAFSGTASESGAEGEIDFAFEGVPGKEIK